MTDYVVSGLIAKRAELAGVIDQLQRQLDQYRADLTHIRNYVADAPSLRSGPSALTERARALQLVGDIAERVAEVRSHQGKGGDRRDGNQCGDQRILDRRYAGLVLDQIRKKRAQLNRPSLVWNSRVHCEPNFKEFLKSR
jgi:hypothetical protein